MRRCLASLLALTVALAATVAADAQCGYGYARGYGYSSYSYYPSYSYSYYTPRVAYVAPACDCPAAEPGYSYEWKEAFQWNGRAFPAGYYSWRAGNWYRSGTGLTYGEPLTAPLGFAPTGGVPPPPLTAPLGQMAPQQAYPPQGYAQGYAAPSGAQASASDAELLRMFRVFRLMQQAEAQPAK